MHLRMVWRLSRPEALFVAFSVPELYLSSFQGVAYEYICNE